MFHGTEAARWIALAIFVVGYVAFVVWFERRNLISVAAGALSLVLGTVGLSEAFWRYTQSSGPLVNWNVMGVFFGALVLAEFFLYSRAPEAIAELLLSRVRSARLAMVLLCFMAGFVSFFIENVAAVLILAPVGFSVAKKLGQPSAPVIIGMVLASNLHGCGTMIGDPPDMLLAAKARMSFNDFFWMQGRPSLFFSVLAGSLSGLLVLSLFFRGYREKIEIRVRTPVISWTPTILLGLLIAFLTGSAWVDPDFVWYAGTVCMAIAILGTGWYLLYAPGGLKEPEAELDELALEMSKSNFVFPLVKVESKRQKALELVRGLDWGTGAFLVGVFIFVGAAAEFWAEPMAHVIRDLCGSNILVTFVVIVALSLLLSAFIDNVPYLVAMLPVVEKLGPMLGYSTGVEPYFLYFGLLIGCSVGGNITPIGATANVVAMGLLKKRGEPVGFLQYVRMGLPFTLAATLAACAFLSIFWKP